MKFTMAADKNVATKLGHTIEFKKGVPTHVPKECWRDVQAAGAIPDDAEKVVEQAAPPKEVTTDPDDRKEAIFKAFKQMVDAMKRDDFTAAGIPKAASVSAITGFDVDSKERDAAWIEFSQQKED